MDRTPLVRRLSGERGYLMVALLVALSVMAIMMSAAMPAWHTLAQREKESELVFRGEQYARAIGLYQRKFANAPAPSIDFLVEQRFLRKKYKDPITNGDFEVLTSGGNMPGQTQGQQAQSQASSFSSSLQQPAGRAGGTPTGAQGRAGGSASGGAPGAVVGGIVGVTSKSPLKSLRLYNNRDTYNQWIFMPVALAARAGGAGAGGAGGRGADGRGGRVGGDGRGLPQGQGGRGLPQGQGGRGTVVPPGRGRF